MEVNKMNNVGIDMREVLDISKGCIIGYNTDVHFVTLDSMHLLACDVIIIDLVGFEYTSILGAINTIRKYKPTIVYRRSLIGQLFGASVNVKDMLKGLEYAIDDADEFVIAKPIEPLLQSEQVNTLIEMHQELVSNA
jgi:hypothetical protein